MNKRGTQAEPVFIVGMNGSGTTMLLDNLGHHPDLYAFPRETRLIPHLIATSPRLGDLGSDENFRKLWDEVLGLTVFAYVNDGERLPLPDDWRSYDRDLASVLDAAIRYFAARQNKERWCEKTPQHVQHIDKLAALYPKARFIHVIRDGRDSAASFQRRWKRTPELTLYRWKKVVKEGRRLGETLGPGRYLEVHYEDLTTQPERELKAVCQFLGVPYVEDVLISSQPYLKTQNLAAAQTEGRLRPNSGNWKKRFSAAKIDRLERIAGATLAEFGYEARYPDADIDPPKWRRRIWVLRDYLVQYLREIAHRLTGKNKKPWRVILTRPFVAYRQGEQNKY